MPLFDDNLITYPWPEFTGASDWGNACFSEYICEYFSFIKVRNEFSSMSKGSRIYFCFRSNPWGNGDIWWFIALDSDAYGNWEYTGWVGLKWGGYLMIFQVHYEYIHLYIYTVYIRAFCLTLKLSHTLVCMESCGDISYNFELWFLQGI